MLTTRELLADGFGKKNRAWNDTAQLQQWREAWATIQNQHLESLGIDSRVDHRSLEAQGIDREPQQHEGPTVTNMKRKDDLQSVVEENAQREAANDNLADLHEELLQTQLEIDEIRSQQSEIVAEAQADIVAEESANRLELELQHGAEIAALDHMQAQTYKPHLATIESQADVLQERIASAGMVRKLFRNFTGITRRDEQRLEQIKATIAATYDRMKQQREELASRHRFELSEAARRERERKEDAAQSVYEADRRAAQEAAERVKLEAGTMTLAQRLALRSEQLQARKDGLEHKTEQSNENQADEGLRLERDP